MEKEQLKAEQERARKILAGDRRAFLSFYKENEKKLTWFVRSRVKNDEDADEIVQDSFLGFLDSLPVFSYRSSLWTFLVSIARHEIADYYRKLYAKKAMKYVPFLNQVYTEPLYPADETAEVFERALGKLLPHERQLLEWKYDEELSVKEISMKMGVGVKAAESKLFRARKAFMMAYEEINGQS